MMRCFRTAVTMYMRRDRQSVLILEVAHYDSTHIFSLKYYIGSTSITLLKIAQGISLNYVLTELLNSHLGVLKGI